MFLHVLVLVILANPALNSESLQTAEEISYSGSKSLITRNAENDPPEGLAIPTPFPLVLPPNPGQGQGQPQPVAPELLVGTFQMIRMPMAGGGFPAGLPDLPGGTGLPSVLG